MEIKKLKEAQSSTEGTVESKQRLNAGNVQGVTNSDPNEMVDTKHGKMDKFSSTFYGNDKFTVTNP